ncbi:MAG TPA: AMP-binding protein, partial [Longimicrobium sp.]|nr:AMP-binding protein [Longimicrobium sp.]
PLSALALQDGGERRRMVEEWSRGVREEPAGLCVHDAFAAQAARTPDAQALRFAGRGTTYRELDEAANRLAHHLAARGVGPEVRVGIFAERAPETVVSILAVLKAGGAYVPLDPAYPAERLRYMLADAGARTSIAPAGCRRRRRGWCPTCWTCARRRMPSPPGRRPRRAWPWPPTGWRTSSTPPAPPASPRG